MAANYLSLSLHEKKQVDQLTDRIYLSWGERPENLIHPAILPSRSAINWGIPLLSSLAHLVEVTEKSEQRRRAMNFLRFNVSTRLRGYPMANPKLCLADVNKTVLDLSDDIKDSSKYKPIERRNSENDKLDIIYQQSGGIPTSAPLPLTQERLSLHNDGGNQRERGGRYGQPGRRPQLSRHLRVLVFELEEAEARSRALQLRAEWQESKVEVARLKKRLHEAIG